MFKLLNGQSGHINNIKVEYRVFGNRVVSHSKDNIFIQYIIDTDKLIIKVGDKGIGFDNEVVAIPKIEEKLNSDHKRGWGLQLMKELMDTVEFQSNKDGTTVTMTKNR